jgi:hypothetical protein
VQNHCRFPNRFVLFGALYIPNSVKNKNKWKNILLSMDESLMFPLAVQYDADIHNALAGLRILDGTLPRHNLHGAPASVILFAPGPAHTAKFFVIPSTPVLG